MSAKQNNVESSSEKEGTTLSSLEEQRPRSGSLGEQAMEALSHAAEKTADLAHGAGEAIIHAYESTKGSLQRLMSGKSASTVEDSSQETSKEEGKPTEEEEQTVGDRKKRTVPYDQQRRLTGNAISATKASLAVDKMSDAFQASGDALRRGVSAATEWLKHHTGSPRSSGLGTSTSFSSTSSTTTQLPGCVPSDSEKWERVRKKIDETRQ